MRTNLLAAAAAFFLSLVTYEYTGMPVRLELPAVSFLYIFSMYSINNYFERDLLKLSNPYKYAIYGKYGVPFLLASIVSMALSIYLSLRFIPLTTALIAGSYLLGFIYSTAPVKRLVAKTGMRFMRILYNSKIVTCFGWIIIAILVPMTAVSLPPVSMASMVSLSALVFALVFLRTTLMDLIAFQGDLILGRETLPIMIGMRSTRILSALVSAAGVSVFVILTLMTKDWLFLFLTATILYYQALMLVINRLNYLIALKYEVLVDLNFALLIIIYAALRLF